jgi:hypothetical protein
LALRLSKGLGVTEHPLRMVEVETQKIVAHDKACELTCAPCCTIQRLCSFSKWPQIPQGGRVFMHLCRGSSGSCLYIGHPHLLHAEPMPGVGSWCGPFFSFGSLVSLSPSPSLRMRLAICISCVDGLAEHASGTTSGALNQIAIVVHGNGSANSWFLCRL